MEKLSEMKNKILKFLPKRPLASVSSYPKNPTLSPNRSLPTKGYKVSIIPKEARRKHRSVSFSAREPSSPKVSCMGEVKKKSKKKIKGNKRVQQQSSTKNNDSVLSSNEKKNMFGTIESGKGLIFEEEAEKVSSMMMVPSLGTMNKFASGRGSLCDFDATLAERSRSIS